MLGEPLFEIKKNWKRLKIDFLIIWHANKVIRSLGKKLKGGIWRHLKWYISIIILLLLKLGPSFRLCLSLCWHLLIKLLSQATELAAEFLTRQQWLNISSFGHRPAQSFSAVFEADRRTTTTAKVEHVTSGAVFFFFFLILLALLALSTECNLQLLF